MSRTTAIILARVSTAGQAEEELPIESQIEACKGEAARLDADVAKVFVEEGVSGRKHKRDTFQEAIDYCGLFKIDYFIIWNTARFARNRALAAWTKFNLRRGGTEMIYVSQKINASTDEGWLIEGLYELFDENSSRMVSKDTLRSMMKNARDGFYNGGRVPYGYVAMPDGKRKRLTILEHEATIVRMIFAEYLQGAGTKGIALWLNNSGILRRGKRWTKNTINNLLRNYVYTGCVTFNRTNYATRSKRAPEEWIRTKSHPAIVSDEDMAKVQELIASRAPGPSAGNCRSRFLFTGLLRCEACGLAMQIQTGKSRTGKLYSYYQCGSAVKGKGCAKRLLPAGTIDASLRDFILTRVLTRERLKEIAREIHELSGRWVKERSARRESMVAELRDAEKRRSNLFELLELHGKEAPNLGDLTARLRDLNTRIRTLETSLTELEEMPPPAMEASSAAIEQLEEFVSLTIIDGDPKKVREFFGSFVEKIMIGPRDATIHYHPARLVGAPASEVVRSSGNWLPDLGLLRTAQIRMPLDLRGLRRRAA